MDIISTSLAAIQQKVMKAALLASPNPTVVTIVAVSKMRPVEAIEAALVAGQRVFGENRVQEAAAKFSVLKTLYPDLKLHLIGPLQTNKVAEAVRLFDVIETLDRPKLAQALAKEIKKQGRAPRLLIEVNSGAEPQKAGVAPESVAAFLKDCQDLGLKIDGLMCIPPVDQDPAIPFAVLKKSADSLGLEQISMGMSADFERAIAHGATHVRIGTALFKGWLSQ